MRWFGLNRLASPKYFYQHTQQVTWISLCLGLLLLIVGWYWGLFIAPADYQQGDAFRIMYIHVPCAFLSLLLYAFAGSCALSILIWRVKIAGVLLSHSAEIGAIMALLALVTGSIWGKPMWGTYWIWDARLTSELILFFLYLGLLSIRSLYSREDQTDKVMAILALVGLIDLPIIHYSVYWWNTLHQGATLTILSKPKIAFSMLYPLLISLLGMGFFCLSWILYKSRITVMWRERRQKWVREVWSGYGKI